MKESRIGYYFIVMASVIIVLAGIKSSSVIIVPFLLSLFLSIILLPLYEYFNKKGLPSIISLLLVVTVFTLLIFLVTKLIGSSLQDFNSNINLYSKKLLIYYYYFVDVIGILGIEISAEEFSSLIHTKQIISFTTDIMHSMGSMLTNSLVVLLTVVFMLLESEHFSSKIEIISRDNNVVVGNVRKIISQVKDYMVLKAIISIFTGLIIWLALSVVGTDYAFLWGVVAFLFNFIPNIGSIIAAVPAVMLTLIQFGGLSAFIVASLYVVVNIVIGSIIEPKIMGKGLGLSSLVVFLSLIFWGWLLGIVGMLLSIPLTIMLKIIFSNSKSTEWISIILGTGEERTSSR
jgi:predicted PurR-regulated permease PerM